MSAALSEGLTREERGEVATLLCLLRARVEDGSIFPGVGVLNMYRPDWDDYPSPAISALMRAKFYGIKNARKSLAAIDSALAALGVDSDG
jgi:hypothetical protein